MQVVASREVSLVEEPDGGELFEERELVGVGKRAHDTPEPAQRRAVIVLEHARVIDAELMGQDDGLGRRRGGPVRLLSAAVVG